MTQTAGRRRNTKNITNLSHHFHDWMVEWLVYASHSYMPIPEVQWVISPLSPACPISCSLHGVASPAILHSTESNRNPHGYNPTLPPLYQAGGVCRVKTTLYIIQAARHCCSRTGCPLRSGLRWKRSTKKTIHCMHFVRCFLDVNEWI